ncbi:MAG TPA: ABC transporter permease subunit, partial [Gemmataceae bacterium]|nr:ABC transporter permease subunit [Gemmataceae bacterium]
GDSDDHSWMLDLLRRSRVLTFLERWSRLRRRNRQSAAIAAEAKPDIVLRNEIMSSSRSLMLLVVLGIAMVWGMWKLIELLVGVGGDEWLRIFGATGLTLSRVLVSTAIGTLWTVPAGLWIGLSSRRARFFQPIVQVAAAFPAPMLFPLVLLALNFLGVSLNFGSVLLMLLGTQWYLLFNVIAGAMAIPSDLREAGTSFHIVGWQRFATIYLPGVFPYLVTGWVTAAGGAWNASIVAEYIEFGGKTYHAAGLGNLIAIAFDRKNYQLLSAAVLTMAIVVVAFNRTVWRPLYRLAETRFSLSK